MNISANAAAVYAEDFVGRRDRLRGIDSVFHIQPFLKCSYEVLVWGVSLNLLIYLLRPEIGWLEQKLRDVRPIRAAGKCISKQSLRSYLAAHRRPLKVRERR